MTKMLLKDLAAVACGILCAIICFSILVHFQFFNSSKRVVEYQQNQRTMNVNRALENR